jgi:site-specific recombinase XerD
LRAWLAERRDASDFVFFSQKGGGIHRSQFFCMFQSVVERAGLPEDRRHPPCLKHALGFPRVASNVNLAIVKQALGHKNIASTAIYAVPTDEQTGRAVNVALAGLFQAAEAWTVVFGSFRAPIERNLCCLAAAGV